MAEENKEKTYIVPLRKEYLKAPNWNRTKKAVKALREFLLKHLKGKTVSIGKNLNDELWKKGLKNPPHHVSVHAIKDKDGLIKAELTGFPLEIKKQEKKTKKKEESKDETKPKKKESQ